MRVEISDDHTLIMDINYNLVVERKKLRTIYTEYSRIPSVSIHSEQLIVNIVLVVPLRGLIEHEPFSGG
jgi:hypothetical protein